MSKLCKQPIVYRELGGWGRTTNCARYAKINGYCAQHHPDTVAERKAKREEKDSQNMKDYRRKRVLANHGTKFFKVLQDIAEGRVGNPQALAQIVIKSYKEELP